MSCLPSVASSQHKVMKQMKVLNLNFHNPKEVMYALLVILKSDAGMDCTSKESIITKKHVMNLVIL